ncbi:MAG: GH32 C-terminal domain-containing protein, partial [Lachnospiraceae bacterium]|nr:GH32 C-terminal domain-containing protein [Lachnospiraceae bacterium]
EERDGKLKLRFILDRYSIELFVWDGEKVITTVIYTPKEADRVLFACDGTAKINVVKYDIAAKGKQAPQSGICFPAASPSKRPMKSDKERESASLRG